MRIGIDATVVAQSRIVGISRFIVNLVENLAAIDAGNEYFLFYRPRAFKHPTLVWRPSDPRFRTRILQEPFNRRLLRSLDVFHSTYQRLPAYRDLVPYLGTLHDIFYLSQPDMGSLRTSTRWQARYRDVAQRSRLILTLSEFSKSEIVRLIGVEPQKVRVVPLAPGPGYAPQPPQAVENACKRYGLATPYILFGGGFGRRKNILGALSAFAAARPRLPRELRLVISGTGGPLEPQARDLVHRTGIEQRVSFLGFVPEADYPALITGSLAYFFPSQLEGFGLPALEAMACGAPLLTSSTTSLPEVCADAALLVDPADEAQMSEGLVRMTSDTALREELRARGLRRAAAFSWSRVASQILQLYAEVARGS